MALPFTPAQLLADVPQTTQDPCQATRLAWLAFPELVYQFFKYAISADGASLTNAFLNLIWDVGDYKYSARNDLDPLTPQAKWLICDGRTVSQTDFAALYAKIGTIFGPAAAGTFTLPLFPGKFPLAVSGGHAQGTSGGAETHTLTTAEIPAHAHQVSIPVNDGSPGVVEGLLASGGTAPQIINSGNAGGGDPHSIMPPFLTGGFWYIKT